MIKKISFTEVHEVVKLIPEGKVTSYGAIAEYLGSKKGARLVGWAMKQAHANQDIPAHRVVNRIGLLTGKHNFKNINTMEELLTKEGHIIKNNTIENFKDIFWDPNTELL